MKKKIVMLVVFPLFLGSCVSVKQIGSLNMISTRNIDTNFDYQILSSYKGGSKKELKKSKAETIEAAIQDVVKSVPGGEFLMNAKIFVVSHFFNSYFACEGDVWGRNAVDYQGFSVGTKVTYKNALGNYEKGVVKGIKDANTLIIEDENGKLKDKKIDKIQKSE